MNVGDEAMYYLRLSRAGEDGAAVRTPELAGLKDKTVALFGLGCVGAPSALELVRSGVGELSLIDGDVVDAGTICRWPLGLGVVGMLKTDALSTFIRTQYPSSTVRSFPRSLGGVNSKPESSDTELLAQALKNVDLIYDATAEIGVQYFLSDLAKCISVPYISVSGSYGGWGGRVISIIPGKTAGCWFCYRKALEDGSIPEPASDPAGEIQAPGCGDLSFTGAGFDMLQCAIAGVRSAVSILSGGQEGAYPASPWDVLVLSLRDAEGTLIAPSYQTFALEKHPQCPICRDA
jgi:molybdopterin/thiamine biosynthesis adenylyltransferase